jgi:hypothetical protein
MKIAKINYPVKVAIWIPDKLPKFKYGCKTRTQILRNAMKIVYYNAAHMPADFIVECIERDADGNERWEVGS